MKSPTSIWMALLVMMGLPGTRAGPVPVEGYLSAAGIVGISDGSSGSGFYWSREGIVYFVTARHLLLATNHSPMAELYKVKSRRALVRSPVPAGTRMNILALDLDNLQEARRIRVHMSHDIAAIEIGQLTTNRPNLPFRLSPGVQDVSGNPEGTPLACAAPNVWPLNDISAGTRCFLAGYATSLGAQENSRTGVEPSLPWARMGRIRVVNYRQGTLWVRSRVFPGDSGGPVFEAAAGAPDPWRGRVIGVISEYVEATALGNSEEEDPAEAFWDQGYTVVESADSLMELTSASNPWTAH